MVPNPFEFTPTLSGLELLASVAPSPDPIHTVNPANLVDSIADQQQCHLQQPLKPTLRWMPNFHSSWDDIKINVEHTFDDLSNWPNSAPRYTERPQGGKHSLIEPCWEPYPHADDKGWRGPIRRNRDRVRPGRHNQTTTARTARHTTNSALHLTH